MDDHMEHVEITSENVHHFESVLTNMQDGDGILRDENGQTLQFVAVSRNGQHEYIDNSMLTSEFIAIQIENGMAVNFATTDQTIQAAQHNQQQLLAQTTVIDEQFVVQHELEEEEVEETEFISEEPMEKEEQIPFEIQPEVMQENIVHQQKEPTPVQSPALRAPSTRKKTSKVDSIEIKSELEDEPSPIKKQTTPKNTKELPHKKRNIVDTTAYSGKKLPVHKRSQPETKTTAKVVPKVEDNALACQICSKVMDTQLEFFRHLKFHYEPTELIPPVKAEMKGKTVVAAVKTSKKPPVPVVAETAVERSKRLRKPSQRANDSTTKKVVDPLTSVKTKTKAKSKAKSVEKLPENDVKDEANDGSSDADYLPDNIEFSDPEDEMVDTKPEWLDGELGDEIMFENGKPEEDGDEIDPNAFIKIETKSDLDSETDAKPKSKRKNAKRILLDRSKLDYTEIRDETRGKRAKGIKSYKCNVCDKFCKSMDILQSHFLSHTGERPFICDECGKGFITKSALKVHMFRLHTDIKPHICEYCSRAFRQWGDLKYHMTSLHSEQKNHQCEYCGKEFARRYSLVLHRRIHTGERNYKCDICKKTFRASNYLKAHKLIHTGEKPHPCEYCDRKFRIRADLKRHWNIHLRSAQPLAQSQMTVDEEVAAAIQIIDDGNGGFTMKNEGDTANPVPVAIGVHGYKIIDPVELAKKMPVPLKVKQPKYPRVRLPGDE